MGAMNVRYFIAIRTGLSGCIFFHRECLAAVLTEIPLLSLFALVVRGSGLNDIERIAELTLHHSSTCGSGSFFGSGMAGLRISFQTACMYSISC